MSRKPHIVYVSIDQLTENFPRKAKIPVLRSFLNGLGFVIEEQKSKPIIEARIPTLTSFEEKATEKTIKFLEKELDVPSEISEPHDNENVEPLDLSFLSDEEQEETPEPKTRYSATFP